MGLKEKITRQKRIDYLKGEIVHRVQAIKAMPGFAAYHKGRITSMEAELAELGVI
tara:strand:+ start:424 stop:588 length:165 start_codon:yes stop_codon:yes gene_type:complete